jgi:phosphoglycolate phosphatase
MVEPMQPGAAARRAILWLWDIDGTLLRAEGAGRRAMNRAFLDVFGVSGAFSAADLTGRVDMAVMSEVFSRSGLPVSRAGEFVSAYLSALDQELRSGIARLVPGIPAIFAAAASAEGIFHALGTGNMERGARIKLDCFGLNRYFPVGGFGDEPWPRARVLELGVKRARAHYGVDFAPEDVVVLGDTRRDIEAARAIGARAVAVLTGAGTRAELEAAKPDLLLPDLSEPEPLLAFSLRF